MLITFFAYEIIEHAFYDINEAAAYWNNMKKIAVPKNTNILPVCDFSGSIEVLSLYNSMGLEMFLEHQNQGVFKNVLFEFEN
ncbi:hypothetical protein STABA_v1c06040 [Spiroplasma tabanidicola]|uniref:Uncharacterized protein n=2 Tax=Spiroplasma tabanidicola TaxID=324079 RepID=A0A6I6C547_9MOLU|nr:hypothetical protein STABA_v1c06040 [Spiroplasma tabanidicola]